MGIRNHKSELHTLSVTDIDSRTQTADSSNLFMTVAENDLLQAQDNDSAILEEVISSENEINTSRTTRASTNSRAVRRKLTDLSDNSEVYTRTSTRMRKIPKRYLS